MTLEGYNCYPHKGGNFPAGTNGQMNNPMNLDQCKAACKNTPDCDAITFWKNSANSGQANTCYLRNNVNTGHCSKKSPYNTYVYKEGIFPAPNPPSPSPTGGSWTQLSGHNCYPSKGGDVPSGTNGQMPSAMYVGVCKDACRNTLDCSAITFWKASAESGQSNTCYLRKNVNSQQCSKNSPYNTYVYN